MKPALLVLVALAACAHRPSLLARAIEARGGPLPAVVRVVDVDVERGFPGAWRWQTIFSIPDRYAWSLTTADQPDHYLFDGRVVRAFIGDALVSEDGSPTAPLRSQARFAAVANLDILLLPGVQVADIASPMLQPGTAAGIAVVFPDTGDRYAVYFDAAALAVRVEGPADFSPFAKGILVATYDDFRTVQSFRLPHRTRYELEGHSLATEQAVRICPLSEVIPASAFSAPTTLPDC
ncbi:MAG TPA: hypothetical protein VMS22_19460 [Candidatus Eisenbacteria bacterium]|nr:hypothetical protein [Candidatus Eisenbacteria bacterium]